MDKKIFVSRFLLSIVCLASISVPVASIAWFMGTNTATKDRTIGGEVGLRSYFYAGDGSVSDPYEIVYPIHFYNFSRLQNLGVFSGETHFQIGHFFGSSEDGPSCINDPENIDPETDEPVKTKYLDMKSICYGARAVNIPPIGNEGTPFVGVFEGFGVPIKNLKITGSPEDIGVFGYVDYRGSVNGLVLDGTVSDNGTPLDTSDDDFGVEICSEGYTKTDNNEFKLFSADIDDIFTSAHYFAEAHLDLYSYTYDDSEGLWSWTDDENAVSLKVANGAQGTRLSNLNGYTKYKTEIVEGETVDYYSFNRSGNIYNKVFFKAKTPSETGRPFKYSVVTSSDLVREVELSSVDGSSSDEKVFAIDLKRLGDSDDFQTGSKQAEARLSIVATTEVGGYKFSRVIQTYSFEFFNNGGKYELEEGVKDGLFTCNVYLDYMVAPAGATSTDYVTNYHHGNNIGVLVGHLNGSLTNSYAYNPRMSFNKTGYTAILTESDTGLVGEIGKNVVNSIDPELGIVTDGSIGVMNFTNIYKNIRSDIKNDKNYTLRGGSIKPTGVDSVVEYVSYKPFINQENYSFWENYLRVDEVAEGLTVTHEPIIQTGANMGSGHYDIVKDDDTTLRSDLNKVDFLWNKIIEGEEHGLGVFKIVTSKLGTTTPYSSYYLNTIGSSVIVNDSTKAKNKVYFSTAEYDHTKVSNDINWENNPPLRAVDIPVEYSNDLGSFEYPFSRDHNYVFELDLSEMGVNETDYFMSNAKDQFLINYLSTKIVNEIGKPITSGPFFGFMFARKTNGVIEQVRSLSSYMPVGVPDFGAKFKPEGSDDYLPPKCIYFEITNTFGGNVSIVGNNNDITIYGVDTETQSKNNNVDKALYSMRAKNVSGDSSTDQNRYFKFHHSTGYFDPVNIDESMNTDDGALYGHIFKLPKGKYVVGSRKDTANIYFLAVQGQDKGEMDTTTFADIGYKVENVDFLTEAPTYAKYKSGTLDEAGVSFTANFNETETQTFYITAKNYSETPVLWLNFTDGATPFVTYLVTYSESSSPLYIQDNETPYQQVSVPYRSSSGSGG